MASEKILTEAQCKAAKPSERIFYLSDGGGLRLRVRPNGSRHWIFRYRIANKEKSSSLGAYPQVSLREARQKALGHRGLVSEGKDPVVMKRVAKTVQETSSQLVFESLAAAWLSHNKDSWSSHHYERNLGLVQRYLLPELGKLPIESIQEAFLFSVLKKVYDSGIKESARRTRGVASQIFSHGRALHLCSINPARDMADNPYFKKPAVKHHKALPQKDVSTLVTKLRIRGEKQLLEISTLAGLLMALYTGLRDSAIRGALWQEINLETKLWIVPAGRMKSRKEHSLPLPAQALAILTELEAHTFKGPESYVFASRSRQGNLSENTLRMALHRLGFEVTVHGMRSLITDVLNEHGFSPDWIEKQLDHQERNKVRAAYLRTNFFEQRVTMMQWFADWCDDPTASSNVVPLRGSSAWSSNP